MLTLENVSFDVKDEKGEKDIIKNLSLTIDDNKFVVITGPNGGGKSTLAKLIAGIYKLSLIHIFGMFNSVVNLIMITIANKIASKVGDTTLW